MGARQKERERREKSWREKDKRVRVVEMIKGGVERDRNEVGGRRG